MNKKTIKIIYEIIMSVLAFISVSIIILSLFNLINFYDEPYKTLDILILIIFTIDYFVKFFISKNKKLYFQKHIFDLIAIIPIIEFFYITEYSKLIKMTKLLKIIKLVKLLRLINVIGFIVIIEHNLIELYNDLKTRNNKKS